MTHTLLIFVALELAVFGIALGLVKLDKLPTAVRNALLDHKLLTPIAAGAAAPFAALAYPSFWLALPCAVALSWLYTIFAIFSSGPIFLKNSDGPVLLMGTVMWGFPAPVVTLGPAVLVHLAVVMSH